MLVFYEEAKTGEKPLRSKKRTKNKLNAHMASTDFYRTLEAARGCKNK